MIFNSREQLTYEELTNFIEPLKITIDIPLYKGCKIVNDDCLKELFKIKLEVINNILPNISDTQKRDIAYNWNITYIPHKDGYTIGLSPISLINTIYKKLSLNNTVSFYNLDEDSDKEIFKNAILNYLNKVSTTYNKNYLLKPVLEDLKNNMDKLFAIKDIDLKPLLDKTMSYKNCLFYLVLSSMKELEKTAKTKYSILPKKYYEEVVIPDSLQWPRYLYIDKKIYSLQDFVDEYQFLLNNSPNLFNTSAIDKLGVNIYRGSFELLPSGNITRNTIQKIQKESNIDYDKYKKLYENKINYYFHTNFKSILMGTYGLKGYYGFAYNNDTIVADKLFNSPLTKSILTHDEAIYTLPSDRLEVIALDKQSIKVEKSKDIRINKYNHDPKYNWINKINKIIESNSNSLCTFEEKIKELEEQGLVLRQNS